MKMVSQQAVLVLFPILQLTAKIFTSYTLLSSVLSPVCFRLKVQAQLFGKGNNIAETEAQLQACSYNLCSWESTVK
jgi:hypothetical protein